MNQLPNDNPAKEKNKKAQNFSPASANTISLPKPELPKGGGAIKGIEEKFQVNAVTGTSSFSLPLPLSASRNGYVPSIGLSYNSGNGNSSFGIGWEIDLARITRKTAKKLPEYKDEIESDTFLFSGAEDLVPKLTKQADGSWTRETPIRIENGDEFTVYAYRPRIEGTFARIEKWKNNSTGEIHWRTVTGNNIHAYYGLTESSRIADPEDHKRIFEWLLCKTHDDKGNITLYNYRKENFAGIPLKQNETNRINRCTQHYIKTVLYGNKSPWYLGDEDPAADDFLFRVVFDYGEHDDSENIPQDIYLEKNPWSCRKDPFSSYRPGFEIRTYRRCSRVMMFHCFDAPHLPHNPYLVKSLRLFYDDELDLIGNGKKVNGFSFLVKARLNGHKWNENSALYTTKYLPETELTYQQHEWNTAIKTVAPENVVHSPSGLSEKRYLWVDLFSEGISGILTEQSGGWFYKSNLGNANFSEAIPVAPKPSFIGIGNTVSIQELEGNGVKYLTQFDNQPQGFFKLSPEEEWEPFKPFESFPNVSPFGNQMRAIDLDGDGIADLLFTEENTMRWHQSSGEKGFEVSTVVQKEIDEEKGPAILFSDKEQCIFLSDFSGDGLTDIVRIRNGSVCYWPNLGYGKFGRKVEMDNAPFFDHPDRFNPSLLRLADVDGSGTTDIIYLGKNDFRVWMNIDGNEWSAEPQIISPFPEISNLSDIAVFDFLGSGTACIVYSSPLPAYAGRPIQYIDLMGSKKPVLLSGYKNNCGGETKIEYRSSAFYYLDDKKAGNKWITKLPFPVHCISKVTSEDKIRETVFVQTYSYRHGYFDHAEGEFRGFARVEQSDTEEFSRFKLNDAKNVVDEKFHQPPVRNISWFHTGAFFDKDRMLHQCKSEYFQNTIFSEYEMPEPILPEGLSVEEWREALRACKGLPLRTEVYADDKTDLSPYPYSAGQSAFEIRLVQPKGKNKYASFQVIPSESVSYSYERNPADPRISQSFMLEADDLGNPEKTAMVVYPRVARPAAPNAIPGKVWEEQNKGHLVYSESIYTNDIIENNIYRLRTSCESKSYEVSGITISTGNWLSKTYIAQQIGDSSTTTIRFDEDFSSGVQLRLSGHGRTYFINDDFNGQRALFELSPLGIPYKSCQLAFTKQLVEKYYGTKVTDSMLELAGYVHSEGDDHWWTQTGTAIFDVNPENNFYEVTGSKDVFLNENHVTFDPYTLLVESTEDAIGNSVFSENDYRTLSPVLITDANLNRTAVETDELCMVVKTALMGKAGAGEGDTLEDPTALLEYDLFNWQINRKPNYSHSFAREKHGAGNPRWQENYTYSDGSGGVIMTKTQVEAGDASRWNETTKEVETIHADQRWLGNGRTIVNNKGKVVKNYDPYFSTTHEYESENALVETGTSPLYQYDPVGRNTKIEFPNKTFSKIELDGWHSKSYDVNDTVKESNWYADRGSPDPDLDPEPLTDQEKRAAWLAAKHNDTPAITHIDSLGRPFYKIADYGGGKTVSCYSESDLIGRYGYFFDQLGRKISEGYANLLGKNSYSKSAEKGEHWNFTDVMGRLVKAWDNNLCETRPSYDKLHRPVSVYVKETGKPEIIFSHIVYGEIHADAAQHNMKGIPYLLFDQSGMTKVKRVDFKGSSTEIEQRLTTEYKNNIDWRNLEGLETIALIEAAADSKLEDEIFTSSAELDALTRPIEIVLSDRSVVRPTYNIGNQLDKLEVKFRGAGPFVTLMEEQDYDAKGQRQHVQLGNGMLTNYFYDPKTFRLINLITKRAGAPDTDSIQNLNYTFDPSGNITYTEDKAQQTYFFRNAVVKPGNSFVYDALYQLIAATGREHSGAGAGQPIHTDLPFISAVPHSNNAAAVRTYSENYEYDDCGNIKLFDHRALGGNWKRHYTYEHEENPLKLTNRLKRTSAPGDPDAGPYTAVPYTHDTHGNMLSMPHLSSMVWNFADQLREVNLGGGGMAYYVYNSGGQRSRKIIERAGGLKQVRIYLGAVEIYREYQDTEKRLERNTLHIADNTGTIAQIDTKLLDTHGADPANALNTDVIRYQYTNHLGSATLETNEDGAVISYEEFHPFGTSAYRSAKSGTNISLKRYRFSGKERDDETGLYYFGARYLAAWLGRWASSDPAGFIDGPNLYRYCRNNPVMLNDPDGCTPPPSHVDLPMTEARRNDLTDPSQAAGARLEREVRNSTYTINGHRYRFQGHAVWTTDHWQYSWNHYIEIGRRGAVIESGEQRGGGGDQGSESAATPPITAEGNTGAAGNAPPSDTANGNGAPNGGASGNGAPNGGASGNGAPNSGASGNGAPNGGASGNGAPGEGPAGNPGGSGPAEYDPLWHPNTGASIRTYLDSVQRGRYTARNIARSAAAVENIAAATANGNHVRAMEIARNASTARDVARVASQEVLSPGGRAMSRAIDQGRNFGDIVAEYMTRAPGSRIPSPAGNSYTLATRIATGVGRSNPWMSRLAVAGRYGGPIAIAAGAGIGIYNIARAPEGQRGRTAAGEVGNFGGGWLGVSLGMSGGVALAGAISAALVTAGIISGPLGWLAIGLGLLGGFLGAWALGSLGRWIGQSSYDAATN